MRRTLLLASLVFIGACSDTTEPLAGPPDGPDPVSSAAPNAVGLGQIPAFQPGVVVVQFESSARAADIAATQGASVARVMKRGIHVLRVPVGNEQTVVSALSRNPRVIFAELSVPRTLGIPCEAPDGDCTVPSDDLFGRRWDLHNDGAVKDAWGNILEDQGLVPDADMDWLEAHEQLGAFTGSALVGIVDTGILSSHEDLSGRLHAQHDFFNIDAIAEDDHGHGTHASGIMVAHGNNGMGVSGIAYGPNVRLAMAKGCGNTIIGYLCWSPDIADGIMWLADQGVAAINLSLGGETGSAAEQTALQYAVARNVLPVCAAGNDEGAVDYPAAFPECMAVSSTRWDDALASYSSFGPEVEVAAPGGEILHSGALDMIASTYYTGGYAYMAGTSMAAPQVTGLAGLLHALGVTDADEKRAIIRSTADDLGASGFDNEYGDGRINVWAAVQEAVEEPPPTDNPPVASFTYSCTYLSCIFDDTSTDDGGVVSWEWNFGDLTPTSPLEDPSHEFPTGGTYTVTLTVMDGLGQTDAVSHDVTVSDPPVDEPPVASFTYSCSGLTCDFTDTSTDDNGVVGWLWSFGIDESSLSSEQNPSFTYPEPGEYEVELLVEDALGGEDRLGYAVDTITVTADPPPNEAPTASFTFDCTDLTCTFTDTSGDDEGVTSWAWDLGDGATSSHPNPSHTYSTGGTYTVTLTAGDAHGATDQAQEAVTVTAAPPPNEAPTASFTFDCTDLSCDFTDTSTDDDGGVTSWAWDFGDGGTSSAQNPSHTYSTGGTYTVTLTAGDAEGATDQAQEAVTVTEPPTGLVLTASARKVRGRVVVDLSWVGTSLDVDLYRDGGLIAEAQPSDPGTYEDFTGMKAKGTIVYIACLTGTSTCSAPAAVVF